MNYKWIIFDVDWVLFNNKPIENILKEKYRVDSKKLENFFASDFQDCLVWKQNLIQKLPELLKDWKLDFDVNDFLDFWFDSDTVYDTELIEYIKEQKQLWIKLFIWTNNEINRIHRLEKVDFVRNNFDKIYSSAMLWVAKPNVKYFELMYNDIYEKHWIKKNELVFIDDNENNVKSANNYWLKSFIYKKDLKIFD